MQAVLKQGVTDLLADATLLPMMLDSLPEDQQASALTWFRENGPNNFTIGNAFPRQAPQVPMIAVLPGAMSETDEVVGNVGIVRTNDDNSVTELDGIYFDSGMRALILSPNADATTWLTAFAVFTLIRYRNYMTDLGLLRQTIQASELNSAEEFQPELVFTRAVTLSGQIFVQYPTALAAPPSTFQVGTTWNGQTGVEVTVSGPVSDYFDRADATVLNRADSGQPWTALAGVWGISGNVALCSASEGNDRDSAVIGLGVSDIQVSVVFATVVNGARAILRATDRDNYLAVEAVANGYAVRRRLAGVWTTVQTFVVTKANGDDINVLLQGARVRVYLNTVFLGEVVDGSTGKRFGIGVASGALATRFASFEST